MTDKELRKMGRAELLQMLITERTENESLATRLNASATELLEVQNRLAAVSEELEAERRKTAELDDELSDTRILLMSAQAEVQETEEKMESLRKETDERIAQMQAQVEEADTRLKTDIIRMNEAGSIAEASLKVHGIFETAQAAAEQYLSSIRDLKERQESISAKALRESKDAAERLLAETRNVCNAKKLQTEEQCRAMLAEAQNTHDSVLKKTKEEADAYWNSLSGRMTEFYDAHQGMRELLSFFDMKSPEPGRRPEEKE